MAFTETFGGTTIYPSDVSYRAISLSANQELSWPLEVATSGNVVAQIMDVTPSASGFTITMPPANEASPGETALFFNAGSFNFTVADNAGNTIVTITPGLAYQVYLTTNTTVAGTWRTTQFGAGTSSATAGSLVGAGIKAINTTLNQSMAVTSLSVNYTAGAADRSAAFLWTGGAGTITLPAASTVGNDWFFHIRNGGTGAISLATTGGELINGTATVDFNPGDSAIIVCDGTGYFTIGFGQAPEFLFDYVSIDLTSQSSPYTLSGSNLNRIAYQFSGTLTANMQIIVPATIQQYWVGNFTTGGSYTLTVKTSAGTGVVVPRDARAILYCNGTDVVTADTGGISIPILVSQGGTGATNASQARTNLGATSIGNALFIAVDEATARNAIIAAKSGANSDITSLSGLTTPLSVAQGGTGVATFTANGLVYGAGTSSLSVTAAGTTGQVLVGNTGSAPSWATLSGIGVTLFSAGTTGLTPSSATSGAITLAGTLIVANGGTGATTLTGYVKGSGTSALTASATIPATDISGGAALTKTDDTNVTLTLGGTPASALLAATSLTLGWSGQLSVARGGTGASTLTANGVLYGAGTSAIAATAVGTTGQVLVGNTGAAPSWATLTGIGVTSFSGGTTGLTPNSATTGAITLAGTLGVANGGTGTNTAFTAGSVVFAGASGVYSQDNANLFWDNTNDRLGIGTATPSATLDVNGNMVLPNSGIINFKDAGGANRNVLQFISGEVRLGGAGAGLSTQTFYTSAAERMRITSNGDALINTTTSLYGYASNPSLELNGAAGATLGLKVGGVAGSYISHSGTLNIFNTTNNSIVLATNNAERMRITSAGLVGIGTASPAAKLHVNESSATQGRYGTRISQSGWTSVYGEFVIDTTNAKVDLNTSNGLYPLSFSIAGTEAMRINASGNVGIGTTSPDNKLEVTVGDNAGINIEQASANQTGFFNFRDADGALAGRISYDHSNNSMRLATNETERVRIDSVVNVGIGTSSPATLLHISATNPEFRLQGTNGTGSVHKIRSTGLNSEALQITSAGDTYYNANLQVFRAANESTEYMRINSSGNVGIGTSTPGAKLDVNGEVRIYPASSPAQMRFGVGGAEKGKLSVDTSSNMAFETAGTEAMRINASGNVGIGTNNPTEKLVLNSAGSVQVATKYINGNTTGVTIGAGADGSAFVYQAAALPFIVYTNAAERMRITSAGDVGIGITTPVAYAGYGNLTINGTSGGTLTLRNSANTNSSEMAVTASEVYLKSVASTPLWFGTNNTEKMRITSAGDVGIGTATPDIFGRFYTRTVGINSSGTSILQINGTTYGGIDLGFNGTRTATMLAETGGFYLQTTTASAMSLGTNSVERMRIDSSGNVGIGTASPSFKLDVQGNSSSTATVVRSRNNDTSASSLAAFNCSTGQGVNAEWYSYSGANWFGTKSNHPQIFITNNTERARIDSSGNLLVGTTVAGQSDSNSLTLQPSGGIGVVNHATGTASGTGYFAFALAGVGIGSITQNGTTAVAFNTSSDYRLKDIDGPIANSGAYIDALKPVQGSWKADGSRFIGLLAHEVQEVSETPIATGEKDGEEMQAMDYSAPELIANLIAEIQSLRARVAQLEGN